MLTLAAPLWLTGLALLPVIRWLHRGGRRLRAVPVSHLGLWRGAIARRATAGERRPPDPAWRRRALLTALVVLALAQPQWLEQRVRITLWIDDSLSMLTREPEGTRIARAWALTRSLLAQAPNADVEVRTLGDPWISHGAATDAAVAASIARTGRREPGAPPAALLSVRRQHWLVTDGADVSLFDWPEGRRPDRVVQVGDITRNVGLERLSARRNLDDPEKVDLLLKVTNGGDAAETRTVLTSADGGDAARHTVQLAAGASALLSASIPSSARAVAKLEPGDALAEDDEIVLDLAPLLRRKVATDATCPEALVATVTAHPALAAVPGTAADVQAALDCGALSPTGAIPTIRVMADRAPAPLSGPLLWAAAVPESRRIRLDAERLRVAASLQAAPGDVVLLAAGEEPLIVERAGPVKRVETSLAFVSVAKPPAAEVPLLANLMLERLFGGRLLGEMALIDRGPASARVAPSQPPAAAPTAPTQDEAGQLRDAVRPLLVGALIVLLWEIIALGGQWMRWRGSTRTAAQ